MSYRPDNQALTEPIEKTLEGMKEFESAVICRMSAGNWKDSHIHELVEIMNILNTAKFRLLKVRMDTW